MHSSNGLVVFKEELSVSEAEVIKARLTNAGISSYIFDQETASLHVPSIAGTTRLLVDVENLEIAKALIKTDDQNASHPELCTKCQTSGVVKDYGWRWRVLTVLLLIDALALKVYYDYLTNELKPLAKISPPVNQLLAAAAMLFGVSLFLTAIVPLYAVCLRCGAKRRINPSEAQR